MTSLATWSAYEWPPGNYHFIENALRTSRDGFAGLLEIGLEEQQAWITPTPLDETPETRSFDAYMALRSDRSNIQLVHRIDLVIEELALILIAFVADLGNINALASEPQIRRALEVIADRAEISDDKIETWDPGVRRILARHYPGGRKRFAPGTMRPDDVRHAAQTALETLPKHGRGRPKGSQNTAALKLAKELAAVYENNSPYQPGRSVVVNTVRDKSHSHEREGGTFLEFLTLAVDALPRDAQSALTRTGGGLASLARRAIARR